MDKRVFLIVPDSFGIGEMPDAADFGDAGSNTLRAVASSRFFFAPNLTKLGLFNIDGCSGIREPSDNSLGSFARLAEKSRGKDTTTGHWEIAGLVSEIPFPTYPEGFPQSVIDTFERETGRGVLCNLPYSGTDVIRDFGEEHLKTGKLIVYTSADSVFQIAANENIVPVEQLYDYCRIARRILCGENAVGRVIARPFIGTTAGNFKRTANRHDFSLEPPGDTMQDVLKKNGLETIGVGKIYDIFAGKGLSEFERTVSNDDGMKKTSEYQLRSFNGLCFVNLVDFDMLYGHRNDVDGYARAISEFDSWLGGFMSRMKENDVLMIAADHGCDPSTPSTDHSREYIPLLVYGKSVKHGVNLGTRLTFADISATVLDIFGIGNTLSGTSFWNEIRRG